MKSAILIALCVVACSQMVLVIRHLVGDRFDKASLAWLQGALAIVAALYLNGQL
jgi:hypothetical protein